MDTFIRIFIFTFLLVVAHGYFRGMECPRNEKTQIVCDEDCRKNHNALYGHCGDAKSGDFNCYCTEVINIRNNDSVQCRDRFDPRYDILCRLDCYCLHAALDSHCDWETYGCECRGQHPDPYGTVSRGLCPFQNLTDFVKAINALNIPNLEKFDPYPNSKRPRPRPVKPRPGSNNKNPSPGELEVFFRDIAGMEYQKLFNVKK